MNPEQISMQKVLPTPSIPQNEIQELSTNLFKVIINIFRGL